jgi:cytoskeletal protein CcmA (bactofilin family)
MSLVDFAAAAAPRSSSDPAARPSRPATSEGRTLTVGEGLSLTGTIGSCDRLVVAGTIKADVADCRDLEISQTGTYTGSAKIEFAEIAGKFDGTIEVSGRLRILATGRVHGSVRCAQIEVERGGRISGDVHMQAK